MCTILRHRKHTRKRMNSRGFSSIVGAIFMMLIVWSLASAYFFFTLSQNTTYNQAVRETNEYNIARMSESVQAINTVYQVQSNGIVTVTVNVQNIGSSTVQFTTLWVYVSENNWNNYNCSTEMGVTLQAGETLNQDFDVPVTGVTISGKYDFASWLVSVRGNTFALEPFRADSLIIAEVAQGIGSLSMNFQNFIYYNVGSAPNYFLSPYPSGYNAYYVQNARDDKIAFKIILTNFDQDERDITLTTGSELFIVYPSSGGNYLGDRWYIVNVDETTGAILSSFSSVTLRFNQPTAVYFASSLRGTLSPATSSLTASQVPQIGAVNLALVGQIGSVPFGQNIPFVSIEVVS